MGLGGGTPPGHTFRKGQDLRPTDEHEPAGPGPAASCRGAGTTAGVLGTRSLPSRRRLAVSTAGAGPAGDEPPIWPGRDSLGSERSRERSGHHRRTTTPLRSSTGRPRDRRPAGCRGAARRLSPGDAWLPPRAARRTSHVPAASQTHAPLRRHDDDLLHARSHDDLPGSPAPRAARGCSSRPPEPGRSARLPHRERRRPSPPCPRRRTAADRAQSFGEIRNDTGRGRPGFRRPRAARNPDRSGFGARRGDGRGEAGPECETRERAQPRRRQGAALGVHARWPHVSVFKRRTEAQGMQQTAGE